MKKRFSEEQIVAMLRDGEIGQKTVEQLCREHGVSPATYYGWKRKYSSMAEPDVKRLKELEKDSPCGCGLIQLLAMYAFTPTVTSLPSTMAIER